MSLPQSLLSSPLHIISRSDAGLMIGHNWDSRGFRRTLTEARNADAAEVEKIWLRNSSFLYCNVGQMLSWAILILLKIVLVTSDSSVNSGNGTACIQSRKNLLEQILISHDKAVVPSNLTVHVNVEMTIQDITEIHEMTSTFEASQTYCELKYSNHIKPIWSRK